MNSGRLDWILLVSAAVQAVATLILVGVTAWYVHLTRTIVQTGREQLSDARAILEAQTGIGRARLQALAKRFLDTIEPFPDRGIAQEQFRRAAMWSQTEESTLLDLATALGAPFADRAPATVASLAWMRQLHGRIVRLDARMGYGTDQKEELAYVENRGRALDNLRACVQALNQ